MRFHIHARYVFFGLGSWALAAIFCVPYAQDADQLPRLRYTFDDFLNHIEGNVSFGWDILQNTPEDMRTLWFNSTNWRVDVMYRHYFKDEFFALSGGIAVDGMRFRWRDPSVLLENDGMQTFVGDPMSINIDPEAVRKSILSTWHVGIPIMFSVHPLRSRERSLGIGVGLYGKYTFATVSKLRYSGFNRRNAIRLRQDYHINPWQLAIETRLMMGILFVYYRHNVLPFFDHNTGPSNTFYTHAIGIGLTTLP